MVECWALVGEPSGEGFLHFLPHEGPLLVRLVLDGGGDKPTLGLSNPHAQVVPCLFMTRAAVSPPSARLGGL